MHLVTCGGVLGFLESLGALVCQLFDELSGGDEDYILKSIADFVLDLFAKIEAVVALRDLNNAPSTVKLPSILPHQLDQLHRRKFYDIIREKQSRLDYSFFQSYRSEMEDCFNGLKKELRNNPAAGSTEGVLFDSFDELWKPFKGRYDSLVQFCHGTATVFPGTSTVEADFSPLGQEETSQQKNTSKLAIAVEMHSSQRNEARRGSLVCKMRENTIK